MEDELTPDLSLSAIESRLVVWALLLLVVAAAELPVPATAEAGSLIDKPGTLGAELVVPLLAEVLLMARPGTGEEELGEEAVAGAADVPAEPAEVATAGLSLVVAEEPTAPATLLMVPAGTGLTVWWIGREPSPTAGAVAAEAWGAEATGPPVCAKVR